MGRLQAGQAQLLGCLQAALGVGPAPLPCVPEHLAAGPAWEQSGPKVLGSSRAWVEGCGSHVDTVPHIHALAPICPHSSRPCSHPPDTLGVPHLEICTLCLHGPGSGLAPELSGSPPPLHPSLWGTGSEPGPTPRPVPTREAPALAPAPRGLLPASSPPPPGQGLAPPMAVPGASQSAAGGGGERVQAGSPGRLNLWGHHESPLTLQLNPRTHPLSCSPSGTSEV